MDRVAPVRTAVIALGSNLGDRRAHLGRAVDALSAILTGIRLSAIIETDPEDVPDEQPPFLNAVVVGETDLEPRAVLDRLMAIERAEGRTRHGWRAPRTLDLDLILLGDTIVEERGLVLPHPRFRTRRFVLAPLAEIAPDLVDPVTGQRVEALLEALRTGGGRQADQR